MAFCNSLSAAACLILCGAVFTRAQSPTRPSPIASATEITVVDGGLGTAPPIALPRVESGPTSNAAAELSHPFAQTTNAHQPAHLASRLFKIGFAGGIVPETSPSGNNKLGLTKLALKGLLIHKTTASVEPGQ
jgi:hypothetical protein